MVLRNKSTNIYRLTCLLCQQSGGKPKAQPGAADRGRRSSSVAALREEVLDTEAEDSHVKPVEEIPGPQPFPLVGTIPKYLPGGEYFKCHLSEHMMMKYQRYGSIVREEFYPGFKVIWMFDPDDIATAHRNEDRYPCRPPLPFAVKYFKTRKRPISVAHLQGKEWFENRKLAQQHLMRPRCVSGYIPAQTAVVDDFILRMRSLRDGQGEVPEYLNELYKWAMESGGIICFNKRIGALELEEKLSPDVQGFVNATNATFAAMHKLVFGPPLYKYVHTPAYRKYCRKMDLVWKIASKYINESLDGSANSSAPPQRDSLLNHMLQDPNMTYEQVVGMATSLLFAGIDTTAHTLAFNIYQLAVNQDVQQKLYEEIAEKAAPAADVVITNELLSQLPYLKAFVKETARVMPTASTILRKLQKDLVVRGYRIPAGYHLMFGHSVIGQLPQYFEEPQRFMPERWLRDGDDANNHPFAVLPFSFGPRMCLGKRVAEQEIFLALVRLVQNFKIEYHHEPIGMATRVVNTPDKPLRFKFIDRRSKYP